MLSPLTDAAAVQRVDEIHTKTDFLHVFLQQSVVFKDV